MARTSKFDSPASPGDPKPKSTPGQKALESLSNLVKGRKKLEVKDEESQKWDEHYKDTLTIGGKPKPEAFDLTHDIENQKPGLEGLFEDVKESAKAALERMKTVGRVVDGMERKVDAAAFLKGMGEKVYEGWKYLGDLNLYNDYLKRAEEGKGGTSFVEKALFAELIKQNVDTERNGTYTKEQLEQHLKGHFGESVVLKFLSVRSCIGFGLMGAGGIFAALSGAMEGATHSKKLIDSVRAGFRATGAVIATHDLKKAYDNQWVVETAEFLEMKQEMDELAYDLKANGNTNAEVKAAIDSLLQEKFRERAEIKGVGLITMAKDAVVSAPENIGKKITEKVSGKKKEETDEEGQEKAQKYEDDIQKNADKMYTQYRDREKKISDDPKESAKLLIELKAVAKQWNIGKDEKTAETLAKVTAVTEKAFVELPFEVRNKIGNLEEATDKKLAQRHLQHWGAALGAGTAAFFAPEISKFLGGVVHEGWQLAAGKLGFGAHTEVANNASVFAPLKERFSGPNGLNAQYEDKVLHGKPGSSSEISDGKHVFSYKIDKNGHVVDTTRQYIKEITGKNLVPVSQKEFEAILNGERIPRTIGVPHVEATSKGAGEELLYSVGKNKLMPEVLKDIYKDNPKAFGGKTPQDVLKALAQQQASLDKHPKMAFGKIFKQFSSTEVSSGTHVSWTGKPEDPVMFETPKPGTPPPSPTPTVRPTASPLQAAVASGSPTPSPEQISPLSDKLTFKPSVVSGMYEGSDGRMYSDAEMKLYEAAKHQGEQFMSAARPSPSPSPEHTPTPAPTKTPEITPTPKPTEIPLQAAVASASPTPSPTPDMSGKGWGTGREFTGLNPEASAVQSEQKGIGRAIKDWWHDLTRDRISDAKSISSGKGWVTGAVYKGPNPDFPSQAGAPTSESSPTPKPMETPLQAAVSSGSTTPEPLRGADQFVKPTAGFPGETDHSDSGVQNLPDNRGWGVRKEFTRLNPEHDTRNDFPDGKEWGTGREYSGAGSHSPDASGKEVWHELKTPAEGVADSEKKYGVPLKALADQIGKAGPYPADAYSKTPARMYMNTERFWSHVEKALHDNPKYELTPEEKILEKAHTFANAHRAELGIKSAVLDGKTSLYDQIGKTYASDPKAFGGETPGKVLRRFVESQGYHYNPDDPESFRKAVAMFRDLKMPEGTHVHWSGEKDDVFQVREELQTMKSALAGEPPKYTAEQFAPKTTPPVAPDAVMPREQMVAAAAVEAKTATAGKVAVRAAEVQESPRSGKQAEVKNPPEAVKAVADKPVGKPVEAPKAAVENKPEIGNPTIAIDSKTGHQMLQFVSERGSETLDISVEGAKKWDIHSFNQAFDAYGQVKGSRELNQQLLLALETAARTEEGAENFLHALDERVPPKFWDVDKEIQNVKSWGKPVHEVLPGKGREILKEALMVGGDSKYGTTVGEVMRFLSDKQDVTINTPQGPIQLDSKVFDSSKVPDVKPPGGDFSIEKTNSGEYVKMFDKIKGLGDGGGASFALLTNAIHDDPKKGMDVIEAIAQKHGVELYSGKGETLINERDFLETAIADEKHGLENTRKVAEVLLHPENFNTQEKSMILSLASGADQHFWVKYSK